MSLNPGLVAYELCNLGQAARTLFSFHQGDTPTSLEDQIKDNAKGRALQPVKELLFVAGQRTHHTEAGALLTQGAST